MQVAMRVLALSVAATMYCSMTQPTDAQESDQLTAIQHRLQERIVLAGLDGNGDIATAGSVVTLQKNELQMCATPNSGAPADAGAPANTYKNGKLSAGMFSWNLGLGLLHIDPNSIPMHTSVAGEKFWIVNYNVKKNGVEFKIWTDPDSNNTRYWTWLVIPFDKKQTPSPDEFMNTLAEVLALEPMQNQAGEPAPAQSDADQSASIQGKYIDNGNKTDYLEFGPHGVFTLFQSGQTYGGNYEVAGDTVIAAGPQIKGQVKLHIFGSILNYQDGTIYEKQAVAAPEPASTYAPAPAAPVPLTQRQYEDIAPPHPPPALAQTISVGQTMDEVTTGFGQPVRMATVGGKVIFYYKDMKVTFMNGKVSDIE